MTMQLPQSFLTVSKLFLFACRSSFLFLSFPVIHFFFSFRFDYSTQKINDPPFLWIVVNDLSMLIFHLFKALIYISELIPQEKNPQNILLLFARAACPEGA
jgi:hypothetical protein